VRVGGHIKKVGVSMMMHSTVFHHDKCSVKEGWLQGGASNRAYIISTLKSIFSKEKRKKEGLFTSVYSHSNGLAITVSSLEENSCIRAASAYCLIESARE